MVSSISSTTNKDENGVSSWEKTVQDVNDIDEKLANARDMGYTRLNYARVTTVGKLAKYDSVDYYKIQVQSNGKLAVSLRSTEGDDEKVLDLSEYDAKLEELRKHALLKVPGIYGMHQSNEQIPYDALLMEYVEGKNAGVIECDQANKEVIANQIVDNLIAIHSYVHEEGFGELNDTIFHRDWQSYYKPIAKNIVEGAEALYEKKSISEKCIETV